MILIEKWESFCVETKRLGTEKMSQAKSEAEKIIQSGHSHSHKVKLESLATVKITGTRTVWSTSDPARLNSIFFYLESNELLIELFGQKRNF